MEYRKSIDSEMKEKKKRNHKTSSSPEPSVVSLRSDDSMPIPPQFSDGLITSLISRPENQRGAHPEPSVVSLRSDDSMPTPPQFSDGFITSDSLRKPDELSEDTYTHSKQHSLNRYTLGLRFIRDISE